MKEDYDIDDPLQAFELSRLVSCTLCNIITLSVTTNHS